jgi:hypothetical protein
MVHDHWRESAEEIVDECGLGDVLEGEGGCAVVTSSKEGQLAQRWPMSLHCVGGYVRVLV